MVICNECKCFYSEKTYLPKILQLGVGGMRNCLLSYCRKKEWFRQHKPDNNSMEQVVLLAVDLSVLQITERNKGNKNLMTYLMTKSSFHILLINLLIRIVLLQ